MKEFNINLYDQVINPSNSFNISINKYNELKTQFRLAGSISSSESLFLFRNQIYKNYELFS